MWVKMRVKAVQEIYDTYDFFDKATARRRSRMDYGYITVLEQAYASGEVLATKPMTVTLAMPLEVGSIISFHVAQGEDNG